MKIIYLSVILFIAVIVLAHFFTPAEYHWQTNTISDLAAQGLKYQWIMRAGFISFGVLLSLGFAQKWLAAQKIFYPDVPIVLYGLAILLTGIFSTAPFIEGQPFSAQESQLHSLFATVAGVCFTTGIFLRIFTAASPAERWQHVVFLGLVAGTSAAFGLVENGILPLGRGLVQRALYLVSFLWLFLSQA